MLVAVFVSYVLAFVVAGIVSFPIFSLVVMKGNVTMVMNIPEL